MTPYEKITALNRIYGICRFENNLRVTFISEGWLIVWDHRNHPPTRYDCKALNHEASCELAADKLRELAAS